VCVCVRASERACVCVSYIDIYVRVCLFGIDSDSKWDSTCVFTLL